MNARVDNLLEATRYHLIITLVFKVDLLASISVINHSPFDLIKYTIPPLLNVHVLTVSGRVNNPQIELGLIFFFLGGQDDFFEGLGLSSNHIILIVVNVLITILEAMSKL